MNKGFLSSSRSIRLLKVFLLFSLFSLINIALGYSFKFLYVLSFATFLIYVGHKTYKLIVLFFTFIAALYLPFGLIYGPPNHNVATSIYYTDKQELLEFISNIDFKYFVFSVILLSFGIAVSRIKTDTLLIKRKSTIAILMIFFFLTPIKYLSYGDYEKAFSSGLPETRFFTEFAYSAYSLKKEQELYKLQMTFTEPKVANKYDTYVIVIGESVRRDFMNNYGFPIKNTPFASSVNGIFFNNYISAASSTQPSLTRSLSLYPNINNDIITLVKKSGFKTHWISNQGFVGMHDGSVASIGRRSNSYFFLKKMTSKDDLVSLDTDLLTEFKSVLKIPSDKKLIVVHLMGSHSPFCKRTNGEYDVFFKSEKLSCYVQSIKNTDNLLSDVYKDLKLTNAKWSMLYFADHGLSLSNDKKDLTHGDDDKESFEAPLFITSYDSHERREITSQRSGLYLFSLISQWMGIMEENIQNDCNIISNHKCNNQNYVIDFKNNRVEFDKLPSSSIN